jgi:hypothetical protein
LQSTVGRNSRKSAMASAVGKTMLWALLPMNVLRANRLSGQTSWERLEQSDKNLVLHSGLDNDN